MGSGLCGLVSHRPLVIPLLLLLLLPLATLTTSCDPDEHEREQRLEQEVRSQLEIPEDEWDWSTRELTDAEKENFLNKIQENKYMLIASFTVYNNSRYAIKDFRVSFSITAPSGTKIQTITSDKIYEMIPAHENRRFREMEIAAIKVDEGKSDIELGDFEVVE